MKRFLGHVSLASLVFLFVLLVACGHDKSSTPKEDVLPEYENMQELNAQKCGMSRFNQKAYVKNKGKVYECDGSKWEESYIQTRPDSCRSCEFGEYIDVRDGKTYKTVVIGRQVWMAENLNYETENSYCYNDSLEYCDKYGRLYTWAPRYSLCPPGLHVPDTTEWLTLFSAIGESPLWWMTYAGMKLKSQKGWKDDGGGSDAYGFSALPAGSRYEDGSYHGLGEYSTFWTSREYQNIWAWVMGFKYNEDYTSCLSFAEKTTGRSVRCVQ